MWVRCNDSTYSTCLAACPPVSSPFFTSCSASFCASISSVNHYILLYFCNIRIDQNHPTTASGPRTSVGNTAAGSGSHGPAMEAMKAVSDYGTYCILRHHPPIPYLPPPCLPHQSPPKFQLSWIPSISFPFGRYLAYKLNTIFLSCQ